MKLGVATGCFYRLDMSQEKRIQRIQSLDVEGIELTFSSMADLDSIDVKRIKYLVSEFNFVTVHSPLKQDFTERAQVERVQEFRRRIGAETVVYHPDKVKNPDLLEGFEISIKTCKGARTSIEKTSLNSYNLNITSLSILFTQTPGKAWASTRMRPEPFWKNIVIGFHIFIQV
jgi:sugar phosphate isomerase/epimerase